MYMYIELYMLCIMYTCTHAHVHRQGIWNVVGLRADTECMHMYIVHVHVYIYCTHAHTIAYHPPILDGMAPTWQRV